MLAGVGDEPTPCWTSQPGSLHCSSDSPSPLSHWSRSTTTSCIGNFIVFLEYIQYSKLPQKCIEHIHMQAKHTILMVFNEHFSHETELTYTQTTLKYCVTNLSVTHETVYNAQAGISRRWSRHVISQKTNPLTPDNTGWLKIKYPTRQYVISLLYNVSTAP